MTKKVVRAKGKRTDSNTSKVKKSNQSSTNPQPRVVAIGASAGGLEALRELMTALPNSTAFAYIIAQHLSPTHISMLMNLLSPQTSLTVKNVSDNEEIKGGTVYITPPNTDVLIEEERLVLTAPQAQIGPKPSVNRFFESVADTQAPQCVAIVLSGTGTDGSSGIRVVKASGGIVFAQRPDTAKYDGMPNAAIQTGDVDLILSPTEMGEALQRMVETPGIVPSMLEEEISADTYTHILQIVKRETYFRLEDYKPSTVKRRIARRMNVTGVQCLQDYVGYLEHHNEEAELLVRDTFIGVTSFFRDKDVFGKLPDVLEKIILNHEPEKAFRCWVAGCSSGEEVYSLALLFEEVIATCGRASFQYIIFASDLDNDALEIARQGVYPISELNHIPQRNRDKYVEVVGEHFRFIKQIRNRIVFTRQNVIDDPPFSRLDFISCRNLMIYLNTEVQKRVFQMFHYALNPSGLLLLGKSESVEQYTDLFEVRERKIRLFERKQYDPLVQIPNRFIGGIPVPFTSRAERISPIESVKNLKQAIFTHLAERFSPPSVVIDSNDNVVHFQGELQGLLHLPRGSAGRGIFELLDSAMRTEVRALIYACRRNLSEVTGNPQVIGQCKVKPSVHPLSPSDKDLLVVSFIAINEEAISASVLPVEPGDIVVVRELEYELSTTRSHLSAVAEELESSNEELQSLNEEMQSANEELQSTNEELQTSNEELQSTNEELLTVNEELQIKSNELEWLASDLHNVMESLTLPLLVCDLKLKIKQLNKACEKILQMDGAIQDSSLHALSWKIALPNLSHWIKQVLADGKPTKQVIEVDNEQTYTLKIVPYMSEKSAIEGVVLIFEDISAQYGAEMALKQSETKLRLMMSSIRDYAIFMLDIRGKIVSWNEGARTTVGYNQDDIIGKHFSLLYTQEDIKAGKPQYLLHIAEDSGKAEDRGWRVRKDGSRFFADVLVTAMRDETGELIGFTKITRDVTKQKVAEDALRSSENKFRQVTESLPQLVWTCTADGPCDYLSPQWIKYTGIDEHDQLGYGWLEQLHPEDREAAINKWQETAARGESFTTEFRIRRHDGNYRWFHTVATPLKDDRGNIIKWFGSNTDINDMKQAQELAQNGEMRIRKVIEIMPEAIMLVDADGTIEMANPHAMNVFGYKQGELIGQSVDMLLPLNVRAAHQYHRNRYIKSPSTRKMGVGRELFALNKQGREFPVEVALAPYQKDGESKVVVMLSDISQRRLAEAELRLGANVFSNTLDGILILNSDLKIIKANPAFQRIMGFEADSVVGRSVDFLRSERQEEHQYEEIWLIAKRSGRWQGEVWNRHATGKVVPVWMSVSTLYQLDGAIERYIVTMYDISEQKISQDRIHYLAHYDVLTGLPNRILFMDRFTHALNKAQRSQQRVALLFLDLDNFKQVNDTYGHSVGDRLLKEVSEKLVNATRKCDTVARLSGDEFLILLEEIEDDRSIQTLSEKLLTAMNEAVEIDDITLYMSGSIGIACYPEDGTDAETLLKNADMAMYKAKDSGRNLVQFYNHGLSQTVQDQVLLVNDLRKALSNNEIRVVYQPIIELGNRRCIGAEALLRWKHPILGEISPAKFIPLAEQSTLICQLGDWVLRESCQQMLKWKAEGLTLAFISVNVSGKQIMQRDYIKQTATIFAETGCSSRHISLELTESFVMHESEEAIDKLKELRELGVGIAIDDFGTGYSSLSYLKRLPVNRLKLDRSFVNDIPDDTNDVEIARAILRLGDAVGLRVIAEGVETEEQHEFLLAEGCSYSQGYLYAKPMPIDEFNQYLKSVERIKVH